MHGLEDWPLKCRVVCAMAEINMNASRTCLLQEPGRSDHPISDERPAGLYDGVVIFIHIL